MVENVQLNTSALVTQEDSAPRVKAVERIEKRQMGCKLLPCGAAN